MPFDGQLLEGHSPSFSCYWVDPKQRNRNFLGAYQFAHTPKFVPNAYLTLKICPYGVEMTHFTGNLTTPLERAWVFESTQKIWDLTSQAFSHNEILHFVSPEVWTELIRSLDDLRSYFLLSGSQDFADVEGKKKSICPIYKNAHISWTLWATPMIFYQERSGQKSWSSEDESNRPNQPNQPTRRKNKKVA